MAKRKHQPVEFTPAEMAEDLPSEVDVAKMRFVGRGRPAAAAAEGRLVSLDPDVARVFDNAEDVNEALRKLIHLAEQAARKRNKTA